MHEGGRNENAGAEVTGEEEKVMRDGETGKAAHYDRKRARCDVVRQSPLLWKGGQGPDIPPVLRTRIRMSAATWNEVLYDPRAFPDPQGGFPSSSFLRVSSA